LILAISYYNRVLLLLTFGMCSANAEYCQADDAVVACHGLSWLVDALLLF